MPPSAARNGAAMLARRSGRSRRYPSSEREYPGYASIRPLRSRRIASGRKPPTGAPRPGSRRRAAPRRTAARASRSRRRPGTRRRSRAVPPPAVAAEPVGVDELPAHRLRHPAVGDLLVERPQDARRDQRRRRVRVASGCRARRAMPIGAQHDGVTTRTTWSGFEHRAGRRAARARRAARLTGSDAERDRHLGEPVIEGRHSGLGDRQRGRTRRFRRAGQYDPRADRRRTLGV